MLLPAPCRLLIQDSIPSATAGFHNFEIAPWIKTTDNKSNRTTTAQTVVDWRLKNVFLLQVMPQEGGG